MQLGKDEHSCETMLHLRPNHVPTSNIMSQPDYFFAELYNDWPGPLEAVSKTTQIPESPANVLQMAAGLLHDAAAVVDISVENFRISYIRCSPDGFKMYLMVGDATKETLARCKIDDPAIASWPQHICDLSNAPVRKGKGREVERWRCCHS